MDKRVKWFAAWLCANHGVHAVEKLAAGAVELAEEQIHSTCLSDDG